MPRQEWHISDHELVLTADGETSSRRSAQVRAHLEQCWDCRARMAEIEGAIVGFVRAHREALDPQLPLAAGPRALLRARLADLALSGRFGFRRWLPRFRSAVSVATLCGLLLLGCLAGGFAIRRSILRTAEANAAKPERDAIPDHNLTPGATRAVSLEEVCSMEHEEVIKDVSAELRQQVFAEYGIANVHADDYEVDYLIAPGLGGVDDIHNLWPQPYRVPTWNARAKDALEERLHQLVCARRLDLPTAQREIATDWIAAYKKYVPTENAGFVLAEFGSPETLAPRVAAAATLAQREH